MPVFISYSHDDAQFVDNLAAQLVRNRVHVWVDRWELHVGDSLLRRIEDAITEASALIVVLSQSSVESEWCRKELTAGLVRELEEKRVVVLPVIVDDCNIPLFLRDKKYADFRRDPDAALRDILESIAHLTNAWMARTDSPGWHTDWSIDRDNTSGKLLVRVTFVEHAVDQPFTIDLDSTICETYGLAKEGARHHGYTGVRGYHPLLAVAAGTGDVLMARLREGRANTTRGAAHFLRETVARVRDAGASGQLTMRADSGFYNHAVVAACRALDVRFSVTIRQQPNVRTLIEAIPEEDWTPIPYWLPGGAAVAETTYTPFRHTGDASAVRLIVRRVQPTPGSQLALFATYSYHAFITDRAGEMMELEADHRRHAEIENAIRDLKYGVGLNHLPSGRFAANAAWLAVQVIAHNLARWTARLGLGEGIVTTRTLRRRYFALAGRLTHSARRWTLHLPRRWPWAGQLAAALARLRALPLPA